MEYIGTILVAGILILLVILAVRYLVRQWRNGNGFCCGDCKHCGHCSGIQEQPAPCSGNCGACEGCSRQK